MSLPPLLRNRLRLPVIGAPMFIVSGPELVIAQCRAGIVGAFPALNARPAELLDSWLRDIRRALSGTDAAPFGVNLIVHASNKRLEQDLRTIERHRAPLVITSVGAPDAVVETVHGYGGVVFHDVTNMRHMRRAIRAGVDGIILVCAGAGGHAGSLSPFALLPEARAEFDGALVLAGALSSGRAVRAARLLGADLAYMGTRFIATREANAHPAYKEMLLSGDAADIINTDAFTGVRGNYLRPSVERAGLDPDNLRPLGEIVIGDHSKRPRQWKDIWGAGQGLGSIRDIPPTADLVAQLAAEYSTADTDTSCSDQA